jgi:cardiolipin synthase
LNDNYIVKSWKIPIKSSKNTAKTMKDYKKDLPNILTISRIVIIPIFIISFYFGQDYKILSAVLFIIASITDFLDGYLSRKWGTESKLGALLDPTADKMIVLVALVMLIHFKVAHLLPALLIMCREIFVSGLREYLATKNISVPVTKLAKWKTGIQMAALIILLIDAGRVNEFFYWAGNVALWIAAGLTVYTGYAYFAAVLRNNLLSDDVDAEVNTPDGMNPLKSDFISANAKASPPSDDDLERSFARALADAEKKEHNG